MEKLTQFWNWLKSLPIWLRIVVLVLIAGLCLIASTSCGQLVKVTVRDTPSGVEISTNQTKKDSSSTSINVNPNINFTRP